MLIVMNSNPLFGLLKAPPPPLVLKNNYLFFKSAGPGPGPARAQLGPGPGLGLGNILKNHTKS